MQELRLTQKFVEESNSTNSNSDKLAVIEKYANQPDVLKVLQYTYDTFKQYGVTSATVKRGQICVCLLHLMVQSLNC